LLDGGRDRAPEELLAMSGLTIAVPRGALLGDTLDLLGRFGRPLSAVGFALGIDRLHIALAGEEAQT